MPDLSQSSGNQRAALLEQLASHERAAAELRAILGETACVPSAGPRVPRNAALPTLSADQVPICRVAKGIHITESTLRRWCAQHQLGRRHGGRWYVYLSRLEAFLGHEVGIAPNGK